MEQESNSLWKYVTSVACGALLCYAYVRFGFELPGILGIPQRISSEALVTTAEMSLYDCDASDTERLRALSMVLANRPELMLEVNQQLDGAILETVLRRKAVREAKLLKQRVAAYDMALQKPALRSLNERKHKIRDLAKLKRAMLADDLHENEFLIGYLRRRFPDASSDELLDITLGVYQHGLTPEEVRTASADNVEQPHTR
ncbi:MAG: hypothetical protein KDA42_13955 [Planctomycetales bacterium]|nr:hypothetical protein [Planctomycetales bacterium]